MSAVGGRILLADAGAKQKVSAIWAQVVRWSSVRRVARECCYLMGSCAHDLQAHGGSLWLCAAQTFLVIEDSKEVVGRRRRHQAGMRRCRPRGQRSTLWPQRAAAWPLRAGATFGTHEGRHARVLFSRLNHFSRECPYDWCNEPVTVRIPCSAFVIKSVLSDSHNPQALPQAHSELRGVMYTAHVRTAAGCRWQRAGGAAHRVRGRGPPPRGFYLFR